VSRPTAAKLLVKPGARVWISPPERAALVGPLPDDAVTATGLGDASVAIVFMQDAAAVTSFLEEHGSELSAPGILWFCYPKGGRADIDRDSLWPMVAVHGMRPITQVALDETWSALRFRPLAPGESPFMGGR
jgi:hypothetical protein